MRCRTTYDSFCSGTDDDLLGFAAGYANVSKIIEMIGLLKEQWGIPREAVHRGKRCPFLLVCSFAADSCESLPRLPGRIPGDIREFWLITRTATLFKDQQYGQWGVEIMDPEEALRETSQQRTGRPRDFMSADLVLARFFGDSDLVVIACDPGQAGFGSVTIALPTDRRSDWPVVARSFGDFLENLTQAEGDKYWEAVC